MHLVDPENSAINPAEHAVHVPSPEDPATEVVPFGQEEQVVLLTS